MEIPVRAWNRPEVENTPPQANIAAGDVSWFNGKYAGVKGQPVRLMADGSTKNSDQNETITKYLWSFDPDWDTVELEQPAGEVVSYTWDNPKDDKIRCKAVTNYGVESEEKLFDLKVYDTLQVNPGGPYNGRVNTSVELDGSLENSYPGATIKYQWRVNSATPEGEIKNNATHQGDYIELTQAVDNQNGQIEYTDLPLSDDWSVTGEFWTGGGDGADAFYIYVWANGTPAGEAQDQGQYSIIFNEFEDKIQLYSAGAPDILKTVSQPIPIDNSEWRPFRVVFYKGEFEVYLDHQLKLEYDDSANYETRMNNPANNLFGFGARTGGQNNYHRVRNMEWTAGDPVDTTTQGEAEQTWTAEGTYLAGFTARVATSEGLILEDTEFAEVRVEAGVPTAMPGGPYRGGISGGNYSPVPFEGNHPDFVEADDVGVIEDWVWFFSDGSNGALGLDGQDDHVIVNPMGDFPTTEITAEFWMKSSDDLRAGTPMSYASTGRDNDFLIYDYGNFDLWIADTNIGRTGVSANDGKWHHIALTWKSSDGELKFYKDGVEEYTKTIAQNLSFASGGAFVIGQEQDGVGDGFDRDQAFAGTIDDVRIWNVVRSGDAIRENMGREMTGNEVGLVLNWRFEEGENTAVNDQSSYGNDGDLVVTNDGDPESPDNRWVAAGHPAAVHGLWNPTHSYEKAGDYEASLKVFSASGKWSAMVTTDVEIIDGKVAGYVRAADLRTPVREVRLTLTSSHVPQDALACVAAADDSVNTADTGGLWTETDAEGYYVFEHLPLGSYRIVASKGSGDSAHEFETKVKATELTLDAPNQLAIDFVDLSVFPVGGQIVYSIQKSGENVLVEGVQVTAQPVGSTSGIEALPSAKSLSATNTNYSLPLFAGKYLFLAKKEARDIRIKEETPGYDSKTGLVTIEDARTDIDFVDYTSYELTVFVEDSGEYALSGITVTISGDNGQAEGQTDENDGKFVATLNPGEYTVTVDGAMPKGEKVEKPAEVDLTGGNEAVTMVIPSKIELSFSPRPKLLDVAQDFMEEFGLEAVDNPEGYMFYYPPSPVQHTYTITATSNGHPVGDFTLYVEDEISMMTDDAPKEQMMEVIGEEAKFTVKGGRPKTTDDAPPLSAPKKVTFRVVKDGYEDSDPVEDEVIVLGDVPVGTAAKIIATPDINYTVLHDPPGDGSYSFLDDTITLRGFVKDMQISVDGDEMEDVDVYPSHWDDVKEIEDWDDADKKDNLEDKGLLGNRDPENMTGYFAAGSILEVGTQASSIFVPGALGWFFRFAKLGTSISKFATGGTVLPGINFVQYEISANTRLQTPSGDSLPDILGPGKGDIYFGEGWTIGLQTKYRLGIQWNDGTEQWELTTAQIETYDILDRSNQYIYTTRDIENIIVDLDQAIQNTDDVDEKQQLESNKGDWEKLLNNNLAYVWNRDYVSLGKSLDEFINDHGELTYTNGKAKGETLIFSAGPSFEYSRTISEGDFYTYRTKLSMGSHTSIKGQLIYSAGTWAFGNGILQYYQLASDIHMSSDHSLINEWEDGTGLEQTVGFVLQDDDVGDNIATRVLTDPRWGTPLFFQEPGSRTSDPWEAGTNKAVDVTLEMVEYTTETFDYHEGAHYTIKVRYTGERDLESLFQTIDFNLYAPQPDNQDTLSVRFNGTHEPYIVRLNKEAKSATIAVSLYPPEKDQNNSEEKQYQVKIVAQEIADQQITRELTLDPTFADLQAPRAVITAPYEGERISPVFFPADNPFEIEVVSEDTDLASIQLQIRSKQPDGVWEPWRNLSGMLWEDGGTNENVTVFDRLDRKPPRREFTFQWAEDAISTLGVGEYALRAIAIDKATTPNTDIAPPFVVFLVDDAKPSVLNSVPDYQARESERIYRGELSVTFTDDMRATDFSDRTFYVMDLLDNNSKVAGYVSYSPALRKTVFVPIVPFQPNGFYRVEVKTDVDSDSDGTIDERGVHDLAGNPLDNAFMWTFRTTDAPFEPTWSMNWRVVSGLNPETTATDANNIAAVAYGALDEEDESDEKDARAVPGLASQLRMSFLNPNKVRFDRDIRPADGRLSHHWFFEIVNAEENSTVTIEWQPSVKLTKTTRQYQVIRLIEFDAQGNVSNTIPLNPTLAQANPDTGEIEFVTAHTYTNAGETARHFRLDVQKVSFVADVFEVGTSSWKFFSVPITPQRAEPFVNLGDDIDPFQLYQYDTQLSGYKIYPFDIGEVGLQTAHGYFTRLATTVNVDVGGSSNHDDVTLTLDAAGWHAIGNPFVKEVNAADLIVNDGLVDRAFDDAVASGLVEGTLYRWDIVTASEAYIARQLGFHISDSYKPVTTESLLPSDATDYETKLNQWNGYWFKTSQADLTVKIPAPPDLPDSPPSPGYLKPRMAPQSVVTTSVVAQMTEAITTSGQFDLKLSLTSNFASDLTTTLGTRQNAELGWDVMDSAEPPILGETVAAYFKHNDWKERAGMYNRDIQPALQAGESRTWQLTVYIDKPETAMTLSWADAIEQIPDDVMLTFRRMEGTQSSIFNLQSSIDGWQDMRQVCSVELASSSIMMKHQFEIRAERFEMSPLSDLQVVAGEKQVLLRWRADDNEFISGYTISRKPESRKAGKPELLEPDVSQFIDIDVEEEATYTYQVTVHFKSGAELKSELFTVTVLPVIKKTALLQSYPNPFNPDVWIPYELEKESPVSIEIYNATGQLVRTLELGRQLRGRYISKSKAVYWDGRSEFGERAASGVYFYVLKAGDFVSVRKMVILK